MPREIGVPVVSIRLRRKHLGSLKVVLQVNQNHSESAATNIGQRDSLILSTLEHILDGSRQVCDIPLHFDLLTALREQCHRGTEWHRQLWPASRVILALVGSRVNHKLGGVKAKLRPLFWGDRLVHMFLIWGEHGRNTVLRNCCYQPGYAGDLM